MHKQLKFSWAHIFALLAALFFGYMAFVGNAYRSGGNIDMSVLCAVVMALVAIGAAVIPQMFKASDAHMNRNIWIERVSIFGLIPVLGFAFLGITGGFNYLNIVSNKDAIEQTYAMAKTSASDMFDDYDHYTRARVSNLAESNFEDSECQPTEIQKENMVYLLNSMITFDNPRLANYRREVEEYLGGTQTTINNVSVLSDIQALQTNVERWHNYLATTANTNLSFEEASTPFTSSNLARAQSCLQSLQTTIADSKLHIKGSVIIYLLFVLIGMAFLYLPWAVQSRNPRSVLGISPFYHESAKLEYGKYKLDPDYPVFVINDNK